jgi:hypothetical protein
LVRVRLGSGPAGNVEQIFYSAGREPLVQKDTVPWPESGIEVRPRPAGTAADGRDQVRLWRVELVLDVDPSNRADTDDALRLLKASPEARELNIERIDTSLILRFEVHDRRGHPDITAVTAPILTSFDQRFGDRMLSHSIT